MILGPKQEAWLAALESGKYKQGKNRLRSIDDCYCCLGVACELSGIPAVKKEFIYEYDGATGGLPSVVTDSLNLVSSLGHTVMHQPVAVGKNTYIALYIMNDAGVSFKEIAAAIRKNPELFFTESA